MPEQSVMNEAQARLKMVRRTGNTDVLLLVPRINRERKNHWTQDDGFSPPAGTAPGNTSWWSTNDFR
jgi:hypothetical protein